MTTELAHRPERLTAREKRFINAYLGEAKYSGTEAAIIAGFTSKSRAGLATKASDILRRERVAARLREHFEASTRSADADVAELDRLAHSPDSDWQTPICNKEGQVVGHRFEPRDKVRALEIKLKFHGVLSENILVKSIPNTPAELEAALRQHISRLGDADAEVVVSAPKQLEAAVEPLSDLPDKSK